MKAVELIVFFRKWIIKAFSVIGQFVMGLGIAILLIIIIETVQIAVAKKVLNSGSVYIPHFLKTYYILIANLVRDLVAHINKPFIEKYFTILGIILPMCELAYAEKLAKNIFARWQKWLGDCKKIIIGAVLAIAVTSVTIFIFQGNERAAAMQFAKTHEAQIHAGQFLQYAVDSFCFKLRYDATLLLYVNAPILILSTALIMIMGIWTFGVWGILSLLVLSSQRISRLWGYGHSGAMPPFASLIISAISIFLWVWNG